MKRPAIVSLAAAFALSLVLAQHSSALNKPSAPEADIQAAQTAKAFDDKWPKDVATFLEGHYLDRADVVLTRRTGDVTAAIIRWATDSPFSHAALVFTGPQFDSGISGTFVI